MSTEHFPALDETTAPAEVRSVLAASARQVGFLAQPVARAAHSPALLRHMLAGFAAFERTSLAPLERETLAMTVAYERGCHYCMAMHSAMLAADPANARVLAALRAGGPLDDPRLEAVRALARTLLAAHGRVDHDELARFLAAGFTEAQALEVVLGVSVYELSTTTNLLTNAPLDPPFAAFAWTRPSR
ncbi:MAG TPA: carboxymuconolactone decarboxylase family protein [Nannocystaceae bacterium]|nr:carboxymuconolactone decarboxylase family protein [Nannocystaceae bacterium]